MAALSCEDCRHWWYEKDAQPQYRAGTRELSLRPPNRPPPCHSCPKIPRDAPAKHWQYAVEIDEQVLTIVQRWKEWRAVGRFPDDGWVWRWAAVLDEVDRDCREGAVLTRLNTIATLLSMRGGK